MVYIGKEANNINEQAADVKRPQVFVDPQAERERILKMTSSEVEAMGMSRGTLSKWKKKIREKKNILKEQREIYQESQ
ncbi:MAG: hypothetical protein JXA08_04480 [Methanomicrobiaceae archaeon]|nr:hypothetical protein [Methanomicrobiaceae archaeon]